MTAFDRRAETTSALLSRALEDLTGDSIRLGILFYRLRRRSFGGVFFVLGLLSLVPVVSFLSALAMFVPAMQLIVGYRAPRLPRFISEKAIDSESARRVGVRAVRNIAALERFVRPRWLFLTAQPVLSILGVVVIGLALLVMLPLPFSNLPPAISLTILALGLMERDGLMIVIGLAIAILALAIGVFVLDVFVDGVLPVIRQRFA